ncbi:MAG: DUF4261 domain-containing protein [Spirochaetales bacterium]|nr:DUF4261 domain-containing protein [Spirochaetales bacterium]
MSIFSRFFGGKEESQSPSITANEELSRSVSLQLLMDVNGFPPFSEIETALRAYHPSLGQARCEVDPALAKEGCMFGLIGWGNHVIKLIGFNRPMPEEVVEKCVAPAHYPAEMKERARAHQAHILMYYAGYEESPLEQYVALSAVAGAMSGLGASIVFNEAAHTSLPSAILSGKEVEGDILELIRTIPLAMLFCGFVKYNMEEGGVWMRTYGAHLLDLPDFAAFAADHNEGQRFFDIFDNVYNYLRSSGARLEAGHTMQIGNEEFLKCRSRTQEEYFLESEGEMLVTEIIRKEDINRPGKR